MQSESMSIGDILVVDDNPANLIAIEAALGDLSWRVVRADSGSTALRLLLDRDFALILLDVKMPSMDGFETARLIRARRRSSYTPIVFMTAYGREDADVLAAYELGAVDFLFKPISPEVLRAKASVFVELQARSAEVARQAELIREHERREHERSLVAERERWEAETLRRQMAHLAQADKHKDRFLALLSHELRNPLASIVAGLALMREKLSVEGAVVDQTMLRTRAILERQTAHLHRLVDELLDIARIGSGKIELRKETIALADVVDQAVHTSAPLIESQHHTLHVELPEQPVTLDGDPIRLVQVLSNLLNNSARYTPPHGEIRIRCTRLGAWVEIRVSDNGRGMAKEFLPHVFEAFCQEADQAGAGLGLGLSVVRQIVALHQGTVEARSEGHGRGSELIVRLPITVSDIPLPASNGAQAAEKSVRETRPLSIVLVDDSEDVRDMMAELLRMWGHHVEVASDGESGAELALRSRPNVAFVDISMPEMDGYEVARRLRLQLSSAELRLVAMTGFGQETDKRRAFDAGFDVHIVKPASLDALQKALSFEDG